MLALYPGLLAIDTAVHDARSALTRSSQLDNGGDRLPGSGLRLGIPREALSDFEVNSGLARALESISVDGYRFASVSARAGRPARCSAYYKVAPSQLPGTSSLE